jgi:hypothetical protein
LKSISNIADIIVRMKAAGITNYRCTVMVEGVLVKLNVGLLWHKLHSTRRGLFLLAHWT